MKIASPWSQALKQCRWPLWSFALAVLLQAAAPMLASAAAQARGAQLVEVCTAYGVKTVALDKSVGEDLASHGDGSSNPAGHTSQAGGHCALGDLIAAGTLAAPEPSALVLVSVGGGTAPPAAKVGAAPPDANASWVARRKHGPPAFA